MSAFVYGRVAARNKSLRGGDSAKLAEILAALVPADVLVIHQAVVEVATKAVTTGTTTTYEILDDRGLRLTFVVLAVTACVLYIIGRATSGTGWTRRDFIKMLIPAAAFVAWTVLQPVSAFNGFVPSPDKLLAVLIPGVAAVVLGALSAGLVDKTP